MPTDLVVGLITTTPETSEQIATALVEEGLAACVNVVSGIKSFYKWDGQTKADGEVLLIVKSAQANVEAINLKLRDIHPYDVFEFVTLGIDEGNPDYLDWVRSS